MAINNDFTIYPYSKVIRHTSGTTVYQVSAFYSWLMTTFDEPGYMSYQKPMKYNTPTSYTLLNGWFLDNGDGSDILQYLTGGSIDTSGYATIDDPVYLVNYDTITVDFDSNDIDETILDDAVNVGPLLSYNTTTDQFWVRDTRATPATILDGSQITTGTGADVDANGDSISGEEIYTNIYTIASFPSDVSPQVYIFQDGERIAEWSAFTNWDRGSIDVLIPVQLGGSLINSGLVTVFVRQTGDTFTFVEADLSSGARTPVATETAPDEVNVTKGEWYLLYDAEAGGGFTVDDIIQNTPTNSGTPPSWYAEVVAITDWGTEGVLTLRALRGTIADNDAIYVGTTQRGVANGTPGDTYVTYDAETTGPAAGDIDKPFEGSASGAHRVLKGYQDDGTSGKLVLAVYHTHGTLDSQDYTGSGRDVLYKDLLDDDVLDAPSGGTGGMDVTLSADSTTLISGYSDITVSHINGTVTAGTFSGTFTIGEVVNWDAGASHGIIVKTDGATEITLADVDNPDTINGDTITGEISNATCVASSDLIDGNIEEFNFTQQPAYYYAVFIEGGSIYNVGRSLSDIYAYLQYLCRDGSTEILYTSTDSAIYQLEGQEYIKADESYTANKGAPFGSLAGSLFQGAQGVWIEGMASADANNISLTDNGGNVREPYTSINVIISNTRVDDDIVVYLKNAADDLPNKSQYTSHASNNVQSGSTFDKDSGDFPIDTPDAGTFTVVASDENEEHRYRYDSWSGGQLTLATEVTGTAEAGTSGVTLVDTGVFATGVQRGDIIRNTTDPSWGYIISVDSDDQVTTTIMRSSTGAAVDWDVSDGFEINSLVQAYDASDKFFIPYMDTIEDVGNDATPGSETVQILYLQSRAVVIRVRNVAAATPIQPFVTTSTIGTGGMTVSVIRTEDEVYA